MLILDPNNDPYFNAKSLAAAYDGRWFKVGGDPVGLTLTAQLALAGGGNITGDFFAEFTADPQEVSGITRLTLPDGCLHTTFSTAVLAAQKVTLTAALTATIFGLTLAYPPCGSMRFRWNPTNIAGLAVGTNQITVHCQIGLVT
jgi:hypothetical protein